MGLVIEPVRMGSDLIEILLKLLKPSETFRVSFERDLVFEACSEL